MEIAIARLVGWRSNSIVPNVSWGLNLKHEADMLILDKCGRFTEVEIKISVSDLKADFKKRHNHDSKYISRLYYAVPENMIKTAIELIPQHAGLIGVYYNTERYYFYAKWVKQVKHNKNPKPDDDVVKKFLELGCMRVWSLKETLNQKSLQNLTNMI